jgi:benzylsuccinate CoA-transferase BbsF subunit
MADKDAYDLMRDLQARGVAAAVVQSAREILDVDEHIRERGYYKYLNHAETGRAAYDGPPAVLSKTPGELRSPAPLLGEHTEYVCREILGLGDEEMADLLVEGVLQ